jgi:hypothetical protein
VPPPQQGEARWDIMVFFQHVFSLFALGGFLGLVWLGLYAELEACERLADILDSRYHWQVVRGLIAMPLFWGLAIVAALGTAWTSEQGLEPRSPSE